jgi:hypothetical protein
VASFGVTRWHLVKQGGRDEGGTGPLVGWVREEMGSRGRTMTTTTIIHRRVPLSSLVARSHSRATSPTVRHRVSSLTSRPSSFVVVVARPERTVDVARLERTVDVPLHRHDVALRWVGVCRRQRGGCSFGSR